MQITGQYRQPKASPYMKNTNLLQSFTAAQMAVLSTIIAIFIFVMAPLGFENHDGGFLLSAGWELYTGKTIYLDFDYVRPPLPPLLAYLEIAAFGDYAIIASRVIFYLQIAIYSIAATAVLCKEFNKTQLIAPLATISFLVSANNFPSMHWHTIDGIFFCALGALLLTSKSNINIAAASALMALGAMCKQPFYLMPVLSLVYLLALHRKRNAITFLISTSCAIAIISAVAAYNNVLHAFMTSTSGSTTLQDLYDAGLKSFIKDLKYLALLVPALLWGHSKKSRNPAAIFSLYMAALSTYVIVKTVSHSVHAQYADAFDAAFSIVGMYSLYMLAKKSDHRQLTLLLFLATAWCSAISWGYNSTILFFAPTSIGLILFFESITGNDWPKSKSIMPITIVLACAIIFSNRILYNLERPVNAESANISLADITPKLALVHGDSTTHRELSEIFSVRHNYPMPFIILPAHPAMHFLMNEPNPISTDWAMNAETSNTGHTIKEIDQLDIIAIVSKNPTPDISTPGKYGSEITTHVLRNWRKIDETAHFFIMKNHALKSSAG